MTHKPPTIDELNVMAKATNDAVRQEAIKHGELLPVWKDGRVVLVWPAAPACRLVDDANLYDNTGQMRLAAQYIQAGNLITIIEPCPNWIRLWHAEMQRGL